MKTIFLSYILMTLTFCQSAGQNTYTLTSKEHQGLILKVKMDKEFFAGYESIPIEVTLESSKTQAVHDLETGLLEFVLKRQSHINDFKSYYSFIGGAYKSYSTNDQETGVIEFNSEKVEQKTVTLKKDNRLAKSLDLVKIFPFSRVTPGLYSLSVMFDSVAVGNGEFKVMLSYKNTIPLLIEQFPQAKSIKDSDLGFFYYLTGYPSWGRYYFDIDTTTTAKVLPELAEWWKKNSETILVVEEQLNLNENKDLDYNKKIPQLISVIQEGPFAERLAARNQFYQLAKIPLWVPKPDDQNDTIINEVNNLKRWWSEKKDVINWVSRVISENSLVGEEH